MGHGGTTNGGGFAEIRGRAIKGVFGASAASWSRQIIPMYVLVSHATIRARYGFEAAIVQVVQQEFGQQFADAFKKYVRTQ